MISKGKLLAASYVRMSKDSQDKSPEQQREAIAKMAAERGYEVVSAYEDLGISGDSTGKRKGFRQMVADGATRKFNVILCWDQDRFGRFDLIEAGKWIEPLRNSGVQLVTVTAGVIDWTTLTGQLGYMASQLGKAQYLRDLSANVRRGQDRVEKEGKWTRGYPPFGYVADEDGKLIAGDPKDVRIIQAMFDRYAAGQSYREICLWLKGLGVKTRRGNDWQQQSVRHAVNNFVYRGFLTYGKSTASKYLPYGTADGSRVSRPKSDWRIIPDCHEALISQEVFERCQERRKGNRKMTGPKSKNRYALTGLLYCGNCGERMCGSTAKNEPGVNRYICLAYHQKPGKCERRTIKEAIVLPAILKAVRTEFIDKYFGKAEREAIKQQMAEILLETTSEADRTATETKQRLAVVEGELEQAVNALLATSEDLRPLVEKRVRQIQDEQDALKDRLAKESAPAAEQVARAQDRIDAAIKWLDKLEELVETDYDAPALAEMLRQFIDRVEIDIERIPQGKRALNKMTGGRIYFRSELFPAWTIANTLKLASPLQRTCQLSLSNNCLVIHFAVAA